MLERWRAGVAMARPQTGDRINNYLLDERIGTGSFGEVWKAHHHVFQQSVAVSSWPSCSKIVRRGDLTYLDTSVLLRIVLNEADAVDELQQSERLISSELLAARSFGFEVLGA
jgi:serine/threonine protein kinase